MNIRPATPDDFTQIWSIFHEVTLRGDTYAYPPDTSKSEAKEIWLDHPRQTFVVEEKGKILRTYYIKTNQSGPGSHVCNCGYMVSSATRGKGIASAMCNHLQEVAKELGYKAMQFNFVANSNEGAIRLWHKLGFQTVGQLPKGFNRQKLGFIDALVMYKWL